MFNNTNRIRIIDVIKCLMFLVLISAVSVQAQSIADAMNLKGDTENGKKEFMELQCWACHGYTGETGSGTPLNPPRLNQVAFIAYVRNPARTTVNSFNSFPGSFMPPYAGPEVADQDLADIYAFLQSLPSNSPPVDNIPLLKNLE